MRKSPRAGSTLGWKHRHFDLSYYGTAQVLLTIMMAQFYLSFLVTHNSV